MAKTVQQIRASFTQEQIDHLTFERNGKFFWIDETADENGPCDTLDQAIDQLAAHVLWLGE